MAEHKSHAAAKAKEQSLEARAWNETKLDGDPEWDAMLESEFKGKLEFAASRVKETGTAQTNFEQKVLELHQEDLKNKKSEGPMAVSAPIPSLTVGAGAGPMAAAKAPGTNLDATSGPTHKSNKSAKKPTAKAKAKAKVAPDKSGKVPSRKERASAAREESTAPIHP